MLVLARRCILLSERSERWWWEPSPIVAASMSTFNKLERESPKAMKDAANQRLQTVEASAVQV
jgi:hypothetical protein